MKEIIKRKTMEAAKAEVDIRDRDEGPSRPCQAGLDGQGRGGGLRGKSSCGHLSSRGVPCSRRSGAVCATSLDQRTVAAFDPLLISTQEGRFPSFHWLMNQIPPLIISAPLHYHGSGFTTGDDTQITHKPYCHIAR